MTGFVEENRIRVTPKAEEENPFPIVLAVDPSMISMGWAVYNLNMGEDRFDITSEAWRYGRIQPASVNRKGSELARQDKWQDAYLKLQKALGDWKPTHLAIEYPTFFASARGRIAATQGYTLDLAGMVGYLAGRLALPSRQVTLWKPEQWKGSVPKHVTAAKFVRLYGGKPADYVVRNYADDTIDAIMILDFWLNLYFQGKFSWQRKIKANLSINA